MLNIRPAGKKDLLAIIRLLEDLEMVCPALSLDNFWVAEFEHKIVGIAKLQEYKQFFFLSAVGITEKEQGQGIARFMLEKLIGQLVKPVYLYTIIPSFFKKVGFVATDPPFSLPSKNNLECATCEPENCLCMVKLPDVSA